MALPPATHAAYAVHAVKVDVAARSEKPLAVDLARDGEVARMAATTEAVDALDFAMSDRGAATAVSPAPRDSDVGAVLSVKMGCAFADRQRRCQRDARCMTGRAQGGFLRKIASRFFFLID